MPVEQSKEEQLREQLAQVKQSLSSAENARDKLSKDLAAAQKQAAKADELGRRVDELEATVTDRDREIGRLKADVTSAEAKAARAETILEAGRAIKRLVDAA